MTRGILAALIGLVACDESRLHVRLDDLGGDGAVAGLDSLSPSFDGTMWPDGSPGGLDAGAPADAPETDVMAGPVCGNAQVETAETCDDGNSRPGDGCSGLCRVEPNFACHFPGVLCVSTIICGDGKVTGNEGCDDGNVAASDGCSPVCQVEPGFACASPGQPCVPVQNTGRCGDGVVNQGETCDDGGVISGDGCSATCTLEAGWSCPMPNKACVKDEYCGDGRLNGREQCDDANIIPGDGCSGVCQIEPFFACNMPGKPCTTTIVCGDSKVVGDEACDDGNTVGGDGCAATCKQVEPGWSCPTASGMGGGCTLVPQDRCGDSRLSYGEYCDDGNSGSGDGCTADCKVEAGYTCPTVGMACKLVGWCGDGKLTVADGEQCDDANKNGGDGCSAQCIVEANYVCPQPGQACQSTVVCGDRKVTGMETCDDGNLSNSDGCSSTCRIENGWTCVAGGACLPTRCGDALKVGSEQCDDGNANDNDGCSSACKLQLPAQDEWDAWQCPTPGQACTRTNCGNGIAEGSEQCDDANNDSGDGCSPFCRKEPICPSGGGACSTACGDGLLLPVDMAAGQQCDDGNTLSGDGCSAACTIETGYQCTSVPAIQDPLILPVILRDFRPFDEANGHPDFQQYNGAETGIVQGMLSSTGKPIHVSADKAKTQNNNPGVTTDYFQWWYKDNSAYNRTVRDSLTFAKLSTGEYQFQSLDGDSTTDGFFLLDGRGWADDRSTPANGTHNFHFTSEVRYWFEYKGNERLDFLGDDDVWVFVNKRLAVDIGGVHGAQNGTVTLNASNGQGTVCDLVNVCGTSSRVIDLAMQIGSVYEIVVFQAERHTNKSAYQLTLSNFTGSKSSCNTVCGDGVVAGTETCDLGSARNTGAYGTCNSNCTLPARCGDAIMQTPQEECDNGINSQTYGGTGKVCGPGCKFAPYCGDNKVDSASGEACDQGGDNGKGYGFCTATCQLGPRCGDGAVTDAEQCDDGMNNGTSTSKCTATCTKKCGNGVLDAAEQCDSGTANNTGGYGKCRADCTLDVRCGDGIRQMPPETCDDGKNDGSYGTCTAMCQLGPRCGDSVIHTAAGEICDAGTANQTSAYGRSLCTTRCRPAPYCGDKAVDVGFGERCDDGMNTGQPGSCKLDCSDYVPLVSCGDGIVQAPEICDDGANNGTVGSPCDIHCRKACGNGFRDAGEACDDGVNDGSYGTCKADCSLAGYCGDMVKNGAEQCDLGSGNEINPYGPNKCTTSCNTGPYCGDGRIQTSFNEECDGGSGCNTICRKIVIE